MLEIRAAHKDDLGASPAEFVYGTLLVLPGQFHDLTGASPTKDTFLLDLRQALENLQTIPTSTHGNSTAEHAPAELQKCPMVWIRQDGHRPPLTPGYDGPFHVVERHPKFFWIQLGEKKKTTSLSTASCPPPSQKAPCQPSLRRGGDHAKTLATTTPDINSTPQEASQPQPTPQDISTRSGCQVHRPGCLICICID